MSGDSSAVATDAGLGRIDAGPELLNTGLGLYVHVPFCARVCPYCDFAVVGVAELPEDRERRYVDVLLRELDLACAEAGEALSGRTLETVYLGGGTPSLLQPASVERLLAAFGERFAGTPAEVTLELNPGEEDRVGGFRAAGVTRISLGLQSFDDDTLRALGRNHDAEQALRALHTCLDAGLASVSADLIWGAPGQGEARLEADLARLVDARVPHVSAYALTLEPNTPFFRAAQAGTLELPDEDTVARLGELVCERLEKAGLARYEISSFARPGHRARHNQRYWMREDVLGLGVSAASLLGARRFANARALPQWQRAIEAAELPRVEMQTLAPDEARREAMFLGFRRVEGVDVDAYARRYGARPADLFAAPLAELTTLGLIEERDGHLRLTARGLLFADEVLLRFA